MRLIYILLALCLSLNAASCVKTNASRDGKPVVITTTSMIADIVRNVGGEFVNVTPLMPPGVDPHQYKASEGDVIRLAGANIIFHNGLHLEGKLSEVLQRAQGNVPTYAVSEYIPKDMLIFSGETPDPHIWFDPNLWVYAVKSVTDGLINVDPANSVYYRKNEENYIRELMELDESIRARLDTIPPAKRILVTSHDAFSYFGKAYGWEVIGIQGINTASETSVHTIQTLARSVADKHVTCIFTETSVSSRSVDALIASVAALGGTLHQGKPLYSDSLGGPGSGADTYIGMLNTNINSITAGIMNEQ